MRFASPEWFLLLPALIFAAWRWRSLGLQMPRRAVLIVLLLLVLVRPEIRRMGDGMDLWVLVDRSTSVADVLEPRLAEIEGLIARGKRADDRLYFVDFAKIAQLRSETDPIPDAQRQETRMALALETTLIRVDPERASRLLLLTDGASTEPLSGLGELLRVAAVPLDFRLTSPGVEGDYRVADLLLPLRVQPEEPFLIEVHVVGSPDGTVPCDLEREGQKIGSANVEVRQGRGQIRFTDRLSRPGAAKYTARLQASTDRQPGNDFRERWVEVGSGPRILLVTRFIDDPMATVLQKQGFAVELVAPSGDLQVGRLSGARGVILNNVAAFELPIEFLAALDFYVRQQGGGLLMTGGKSSFGAGGYFESPVDALLPVSMELRAEHRKLSVAMAVVLDRSGSMAATVSKTGLKKMDLAVEGAARCVSLLGGLDSVAVLAVDMQAHVAVPLTTVRGEEREIDHLVRRIDSGGGGIAVPTGLRAARDELKKVEAGQRHIVLFADANDATAELGDYEALIEEMTLDGITISVIGMGDATDSGGAFLEEVARLGKGRIFFNADPNQLPALFAQETVAVARSAFLDEPAPVEPAPAWKEIAAKPLAWLPEVDGYNLSYLRPGASVGLLSKDEYAAPLISWWQRGTGRVVAVTFPLAGDFSSGIRQWPHYADLVQTLGRWMAGEALPPGLGLKEKIDGTQLQLDLYYDNSWGDRLAEHPPRIVLNDGTRAEIREPTWQRMEPGRFRCVVDLSPGQWMRGAVQVGDSIFPFGPLLAGSNVEWSAPLSRIADLRAAARASGGVERIDLAKAWESPPRAVWMPLFNILLILAVLLFLVDALATRLGWTAWPPSSKVQ